MTTASVEEGGICIVAVGEERESQHQSIFGRRCIRSIKRIEDEDDRKEEHTSNVFLC